MPLDVENIRSLRPQNEIHYFATLDSTMTEGAHLAVSGAPHGSVILADEQTTGLGRLGRSWHSQAELGVYCSILLRLPISPGNLPIASLVVGLATAEAIQQSTQLACDLRWPNDVLVNERKAAGILAHLIETCIVAGVGINVNHTDLPKELRTPATSLRIESHGRVQSREDLIVNLLKSLEVFCAMFILEGPAAILRAFNCASSYAMHRRVIVEESGTKGVTAGLDENGFLLVRSESGHLERIASGGIRPDC